MVALTATQQAKWIRFTTLQDEELGALEERADELQAERSIGLVTRLWQTVSGRQRQTCRNQIAGIDTPVTANNNSRTTNTGSPITLEGSYNQGKMVTEHIPSQVNNLQMNNTHIGTQVPGYVVKNGALNDNTNQDPFNTLQPCNDPHNDKLLQVNVQSSNKLQNSLKR